MIKAEIITDRAGVFTFDVVPFNHAVDSLEEAYNFVRKTLDENGVFYGQYGIIDIDTSVTKICSIKVWQPPNINDLLPNLEAPTEAEDTSGLPWIERTQVTFLGRKIQLEALRYDLREKLFIMPLTIDKRSPFEAMTVENIRRIVKQAYGEAEAVIPPPVTLTDAEAHAFIMDYAEQVAPEEETAVEVTARAAGKVLE